MSSQHLTRVVTLDSNICRLYNYSAKPEQITLIREINHPENKLRDIELTSDKPGHYKTSGTARGAFSQPSDPKEIKIEDFAREVAKELDEDRTTHAYEKLIVIALPHINGLLLKHMNKHVRDLVTHNIKKDMPHLTDRELLIFLHQHKNN